MWKVLIRIMLMHNFLMCNSFTLASGSTSILSITRSLDDLVVRCRKSTDLAFESSSIPAYIDPLNEKSKGNMKINMISTKNTEVNNENLGPSIIVLLTLLITFIGNQWSRQALYYLCNFTENANPYLHINAALNFSQEMYAALASFGLTAVFAAFSLVAGNAADKYSRKIIIASSCAIWSISSYLNAFTNSFQDIVPLRALTGASQAFYNPAAYTLLSDIFPKQYTARVNSIFSTGIYIGGAFASLSILLDEHIGWRNTMMVIGAFGLACSLVCLLVIPEPRSTIAKENDQSYPSPITNSSANIGEEVLSVLNPIESKLLYTASVIRFCAGLSIVIWKAPFIFDKFAGQEAAFASSNAFVVAIGGFLSSLIGGYVADFISNPSDKKIMPRAKSWVPAVGSFLAAPLWAAFILSPSPEMAATFLFLEYLVAECWMGPTLATLFQVVPNKSRGMAQGLFSVFTAFANFAPVIIGSLISGSLTGIQFPLGDTLIYVVSGTYFICGILFGIVAWLEDDKLKKQFKPIM